MDITIPYAKDHVTFTLPEERLLGVFTPNEVEVKDETKVLSDALNNPCGGMTFEKFMAGAKDALFIVNDGTRPTPTAKTLEILYDQIKDRDVKFIVATGVHRAPTEDEYQLIFGKTYEAFKDRILVHDARKSEMAYLGTSKNGTEMYVNKAGVEADRLVVIGSVEPHYFGGYTGGRKSFLPGIASFKTIEQNHKYALRPEAKSLALEGNPVHEDMIDALTSLKRENVFSIQTVLDQERRIYGATAGDIHDSFYAAIDMANEVFCVKMPSKADIVVSVAPYPMEVDLYQSQKCLDNGKLALNDKGILIMVASCRTGIGEEAFFELLKSYDDPALVLKKIEEGYKLGYHKAAKIAEIAMFAQMWGVSDLDDDKLRAVFIEPKTSVQAAVDEALSVKGPDAKVIVMPEGSITVPLIRD